jgi:hypothetical protein
MPIPIGTSSNILDNKEEGVGELAWIIIRKIAKDNAIANMNAAHQMPTPRILTVARASSRYTSST